MIMYVLILFGAVFRVISHMGGFSVFPPNFAPIGAMALFGGYALPGRQGFFIPMLALLVSDAVIGFYEPAVMLSVYGSFLAIAILGRILRKAQNGGFTTVSVPASSLFFFLVTNFAVWAEPHSPYARGLEWLMASYIAGLPFLKYTLAGDLFFNGVFFGSFALAKHLLNRSRLAFLTRPL